MKKTQTISLLAVSFVAAFSLFNQGCGNPGTEQGPAHSAEFQFKENLSEHGFFMGDLKALKPAAGIISYQLATPLFSDYAVKDRFIVLPGGAAMQYSDSGILDFPDSTIIIKNFAYNNEANQKIMIETRLMVKDPADKKWKVMNYLWNKEQTDAVKHISGSKIPITLLDDAGNKLSTVYQVPTTNDCKRCHINNSVLTPIGPKARNLNYTIGGQGDNQLLHWAKTGKLQGMPDLAKVPQLPDWKDNKHFSLEQRARAYLDVNCAHCHIKGGDAANSGLFLDYEQKDPQHLGIMKSPVSAGGGAGGLNYDIVPGDAANSVLAFRMESNEPGTAMPEMARTVTHKEGVKLIVEWINSMKAKGK